MTADADRLVREQNTREIAYRILTSCEVHHGDACVLAHRTLTYLDQLAAERQARETLEQAVDAALNDDDDWCDVKTRLRAARALLRGAGEGKL